MSTFSRINPINIPIDFSAFVGKHVATSQHSVRILKSGPMGSVGANSRIRISYPITFINIIRWAHTNVPHQLDVTVMFTASTLKKIHNHQEQVHLSKSFVCSNGDFGAAFRAESHLIHHERTNSNHKPFGCTCPDCAYTFNY